MRHLDINNNLLCDSNEPKTITNKDGSYQLNTANLTLAEISTGHLIVNVPATAKDSDDNGQTLAQAGKDPFIMMAPPPSDATSNVTISPLTTLLAHELINNPGLNVTQASTRVNALLNLPEGTDLKANFMPGNNMTLRNTARATAVALGQAQNAITTGINATGINSTISPKDLGRAVITNVKENIQSVLTTLNVTNNTLIKVTDIKNAGNTTIGNSSSAAGAISKIGAPANITTAFTEGLYEPSCFDTGSIAAAPITTSALYSKASVVRAAPLATFSLASGGSAVNNGDNTGIDSTSDITTFVNPTSGDITILAKTTIGQITILGKTFSGHITIDTISNLQINSNITSGSITSTANINDSTNISIKATPDVTILVNTTKGDITVLSNAAIGNLTILGNTIATNSTLTLNTSDTNGRASDSITIASQALNLSGNIATITGSSSGGYVLNSSSNITINTSGRTIGNITVNTTGISGTNGTIGNITINTTDITMPNITIPSGGTINATTSCCSVAPTHTRLIAGNLTSQPLNLSSNQWVTIPSSTSSDVMLLGKSGWVGQRLGSVSNAYSIDNAYTGTTTLYTGAQERLSAIEVDVSGKKASDVYGSTVPVFANTTLPAGSKVYWLTTERIPSESFQLQTSPGGSSWAFDSLNALVNAFPTGAAGTTPSNMFNLNESVKVTFDQSTKRYSFWKADTGSTTLKNIGGSTYQIRTVNGTQVLILDASNNLLPIFSVANGKVYSGWWVKRLTPTVKPYFNKTAMNALLKATDANLPALPY